MRLDALIHIGRTAAALAESRRIIVFGSSSLLPTFPELGDDHGGALSKTFDADLIIEPWSEEIGVLLDNTLGEDEPFHAQFGYHADIIRPMATEQFPAGWEDRLVPLPGVPGVFCLDPHDMAAAKCQAGRPKDVELLAHLLSTGRLDASVAEARLRAVAMREAMIVKSHRVLDEAVELARHSG